MPAWDFLDLEAAGGESLSDVYFRVFRETYLCGDDGCPIVNQDWRGTGVSFAPGKFKHAFTDSEDYKSHGGHMDELSIERARRILWIREVLSGDTSAGEIHLRRSANRRASRGRNAIRQTYLVPSELYIVVLDKRLSGSAKGQWFFHTAYPAEVTYFRKIAMEEGALLEVRK